jgi:hypothetical protein
VKFHSLRSSLTAFLLACSSAVLLAACGGGGAGGNPNQGGPLSISPSGDNVTFYAGIPVTLTLQGGRRPYSLTSSDAGIFPLPAIVDGNFVTVVPNNPGVIDTGLEEGELPVRTIQINLRDSTGILVTTQVRVAQNFLTGYGIRISPTTCPAGSAGGFDPGAQACAGGESAIRMQATFNGTLAGNRQFRMEVLRGNFSLRNPVTGQASQSITVTSDHTGTVLAILEVPPNVPTQLGVLRVIDVATGVYADTVFTISGFSQSQNITPVPNDFTFTGPLTTTCGTGTADFLVFDGVAPYTAISSDPNLTVTPSSPTNPGRFTLNAFNPNWCMDNATIIITDARGGRGTVTVSTETGSIEPAAPPTFSVAPTSITLGCGESGSVTVVGGTGSYFTNSTNPNVTAVVSGTAVTLTRQNSGTSPTSVVVSVSDGRTIQEVTATVPATCP